MSDLLLRDLWEQRFQGQLRASGTTTGSVARQWFREGWDRKAAEGGDEAAVLWARDAAAAEWQRENGAA